MASIDHVILKVNNLSASVAFYCDVLGFERAGQEGPFTVIRVSDDFILQLSPSGTEGGEHYAFALDGARFRRTFAFLVWNGDILTEYPLAGLGRLGWVQCQDIGDSPRREAGDAGAVDMSADISATCR